MNTNKYPKFSAFEEQLFFSTIRIERPGTGSMGTGFLVQVPSCIEGKKYVFLVSNKHVLDDPSAETQISFHLNDNEGKPLLGETFNTSVIALERAYYASELPEVDLALINVSELFDLAKTNTGKDINCRNLTLEIFSDYDEGDLVPGKDIIFIGYPNNRYDHKNYLPILRGGIIASIPKIDFEGKPQVLVDAQVFQGSSGSPVFTILNNRWVFIGVIFQTMIRSEEVISIDTLHRQFSQEVLGIGLMLKSTEVKKLILKAKSELDAINNGTQSQIS